MDSKISKALNAIFSGADMEQFKVISMCDIAKDVCVGSGVLNVVY